MQTSTALPVGVGAFSAILSLLSFDWTKPLTFGVNAAVGLLGTEYEVWGSLDPTAASTDPNITKLFTFTAPNGTLPENTLGELQYWPAIFVRAPNGGPAGTFFVTGSAAAGAAVPVAVAAPAGTSFSAAIDLTTFAPDEPVRIGGDKSMTSGDIFEVFVYEDPAINPLVTGAAGGIHMGTVQGGVGTATGSTLDHPPSILVQGYPRAALQRAAGTTVGNVEAVGVLPGSGLGIPISQNADANTIAERTGDGSLRAFAFRGNVGLVSQLIGDSGALVEAVAADSTVTAPAGGVRVIAGNPLVPAAAPGRVQIYGSENVVTSATSSVIVNGGDYTLTTTGGNELHTVAQNCEIDPGAVFSVNAGSDISLNSTGVTTVTAGTTAALTGTTGVNVTANGGTLTVDNTGAGATIIRNTGTGNTTVSSNAGEVVVEAGTVVAPPGSVAGRLSLVADESVIVKFATDFQAQRSDASVAFQVSNTGATFEYDSNGESDVISKNVNVGVSARADFMSWGSARIYTAGVWGGGALLANCYSILDGTAGADRFIIDTAGRVSLGATTPDPSAALDVQSTTGGVLLPRLTTAQRNAIAAPAEGLMIYNLDLHKVEIRVAAAWETVTSA